MKKIETSVPMLAVIAGTRGLLGAGIGMLVAQYVPRRNRQIVGWSLVAAGALSTIPLAISVIKKIKAVPAADEMTGVRRSSLQSWPEVTPAEEAEAQEQAGESAQPDAQAAGGAEPTAQASENAAEPSAQPSENAEPSGQAGDSGQPCRQVPEPERQTVSAEL